MTSLQSHQSKVVLRNTVLVAFIVSSLLVLLGSLYNNANYKYVRALHTKECSRSVLNIYEELSHICCDDEVHKNNAVCLAAFDCYIHILSSSHAHYIPFLPLAIHSVTEVILNAFIGNNNILQYEKIFTSTLLRIIIIGLIVFFRTGFLYIIAGLIEKSLQSPENGNCWYAEYLRGHLCREQFDFSDHIVLFICQYFTPCCLEIASIITKISCQLPYPLPYGKGFIYYSPPLITAFVLILLNVRALLFTAAFFHSFSENVIAFLLSTIFVGIPMYLFADTRFWAACVFGSAWTNRASTSSSNNSSASSNNSSGSSTYNRIQTRDS